MVIKDGTIKILGIYPAKIELERTKPLPSHPEDSYPAVNSALQNLGLRLLEDTSNLLVHKIKDSILEAVWNTDEPPVFNLSVLLSSKLKHNYVYMSNLFSGKLGITIEKFYIHHKIQRVMQLLINEELSLADIAHKLHYSSPAHLSNQFKKVTGLTPSCFKQKVLSKKL